MVFAIALILSVPAIADEDENAEASEPADPYAVYRDEQPDAAAEEPDPYSIYDEPSDSKASAPVPDREPRNRAPLPNVEIQGVFDNDIFIFNVSGGDRGYTNGLRFAILWPPGTESESAFDRWRDAANTPIRAWFLDLFENGGERVRPRVGVALGQEIYTPKELKLRTVIPDDRPYAGWLYAAFLFDLEGAVARMSLEMQLGGTGELSGAEAVQKFIHQNMARGSKYPRGWGHQIATGVGVNLNMTVSHLLFNVQSPRAWGVPIQFLDSQVYARTRVGTFVTSQAMGGIIRLGQIRTSWREKDAGEGDVKDRRIPDRFRNWGTDLFQLYVYSRLQSEFVLRNSALQGLPYIENEHTVNIQPLVHEGETGIVFQPVNLFDIRFAATHRTQETREGTFDPGGHTWGSFRLNIYLY